MTKRITSGSETSPGVYHAREWGQQLETNLLDLLIDAARRSDTRKARFCVHPDREEILQITYLAFIHPYFDRIHRHPGRAEIVIPIQGKAMHSTFDSEKNLSSNQLLDGSNPVALTTIKDAWHSIEILSDFFVMIEIGLGPFTSNSTVYI
jgi:cupin fold WbuC family metalloprotein